MVVRMRLTLASSLSSIQEIIKLYIYKLIMEGNGWESFQFKNLVISWRVIPITFRRAFTTAHSSTKAREDFFFRVSSNSSLEKGFGQCGLPPKKKLCYLADIHDCKAFVSDLQELITVNSGKICHQDLDQFKNELFKAIPQEYFRYFHQENVCEQKFHILAKQIIFLLYWTYRIKKPHYKAAITALEFALLDYFAKTLKISLTSFIFPPKMIENKVAYSFYTLSYEQDPEKMIENALQFLKFTSYIKVKYVDSIAPLLNMLLKLQQVSQNRINGYMIDANASWKPRSFRQMNVCLSSPIYSKIRNKMMYIQQPFPVQMTQGQYEQWKILKEESVIKIMLDESFSSFDENSPALSLGHAINIKSQKAGGPINCVRSALLAKQYGLQVMLGSMVSTHHGCTQTYCLYPLTEWLDVDGSLLVQTPDLQGGFGWNGNLPLKQPESKYFGVEIDTSKLE